MIHGSSMQLTPVKWIAQSLLIATGGWPTETCQPIRGERDMKPSQVKPISYLKSHAAEIVRDITESGEPMPITQNGEAKVVVQDAQAYEDMQQTIALLKILAMGQNDIETGNFTPTDEVFADLERMDSEEGIE
jgi:prevent-host-death family protein